MLAKELVDHDNAFVKKQKQNQLPRGPFSSKRIPLFLGVELRCCVCSVWILLTPPCCPPPQLLGTCDPQPGRPGLTLGPLAQGNPSLWPTGTGKVRKPFPYHVSGCTPRHHSLSTDPPGIRQKPPCEAETPGTWLLSSCPLPGQHACLW